jgi:hypothetical protein
LMVVIASSCICGSQMIFSARDATRTNMHATTAKRTQRTLKRGNGSPRGWYSFPTIYQTTASHDDDDIITNICSQHLRKRISN